MIGCDMTRSAAYTHDNGEQSCKGVLGPSRSPLPSKGCVEGQNATNLHSHLRLASGTTWRAIEKHVLILQFLDHFPRCVVYRCDRPQRRLSVISICQPRRLYGRGHLLPFTICSSTTQPQIQCTAARTQEALPPPKWVGKKEGAAASSNNDDRQH